MECYSDHNEDIRVYGFCFYCGEQADGSINPRFASAAIEAMAVLYNGPVYQIVTG